jgi:hypothetical protein
MGWWKCSADLFKKELLLRLKETTGKGDKWTLRFFYFICIMNECADGKIFLSSKDMMMKTNIPSKQCDLFWETFITNKILRKDGEGYSTKKWMQEQGLLPDEQNQITQPSSHEPEQPKRQYEVKEQVRPNVRLSRKEIEALKKDYSDDEITRMLDKLSDYKSNTGRNYSSDYQAIRKWVYKTLEEPEKKKPEIIEYPDWIFGIKEGTNDKG